MFGRVGYLVVVDVYLRAGKDVAFSQAEQEPRVDLYAAVTVFAGTVASDVIFVRAVTDAVEVVFRILVDKLSEDAEAVAFKEELWLYHQVDAAFEHIGYGHGQHRTQLCGVAWIHTESHQRASAYQCTEIGRIAGTAQYIIVEISAGYPLFAQFLFGQCGSGVVGSCNGLLLC